MRKILGLYLAALAAFIFGVPAQACTQLQNGAAATPQAQLQAALRLMRVPPSDAAVKPRDLVPPAPPSIVGLWDVKGYVQGQFVGEIFDMWGADGTEVEVDASNPLYGNVCNGVYIQTGTLLYRLTHPSWNFDGNGNLIGTVIIRELITLDPKGDRYTGVVTYDVFDLNGRLVSHNEGNLVATRVKAG
jgi:hypothetical protein